MWPFRIRPRGLMVKALVFGPVHQRLCVRLASWSSNFQFSILLRLSIFVPFYLYPGGECCYYRFRIPAVLREAVRMLVGFSGESTALPSEGHLGGKAGAPPHYSFSPHPNLVLSEQTTYNGPAKTIDLLADHVKSLHVIVRGIFCPHLHLSDNPGWQPNSCLASRALYG